MYFDTSIDTGTGDKTLYNKNVIHALADQWKRIIYKTTNINI